MNVPSVPAFCPRILSNTAINATYVYDAENRLIWTAGYRYVYDGDGKRVEKCVAATSTTPCPTSGTNGTLYWTGIGSDTLDESDLSGNPQEEYIFFNGQRIARRDVTSTGATIAVHYYFSDHLGSHSVITNAAGTAIEQDIDYYPYGGVEHDYATAPVTQRYKFTGKERDTESGLDNFGARYDASSLGRFMSADPLLGSVADPQTLNRYAYVRNNPLNLTDPTGLTIDGSHEGEWCQSVRAFTEAMADLGNREILQAWQWQTTVNALWVVGGGSNSDSAQNQSQQSQLPNPAQVVFNQVKKEFSDLPLSEKNVKDLGAHNGHENIQVNGTASKDQLAQIQKTLDQNKGMFGPGSRIDIKIGDKSFSLHVEFFQSSGSGDTRNVQFQSHIDRGNPNRDVVGMGTHALVDGFRGAVFHPHDPGLDPQ